MGGYEFYLKHGPSYLQRQMKPEYKKSETGVKMRAKSKYFVVTIFSYKWFKFMILSKLSIAKIHNAQGKKPALKMILQLNEIINSSCTLDYPWAVSIDLGKTHIWGNLRFYSAFLAHFIVLTQPLKYKSKKLDNIV